MSSFWLTPLVSVAVIAISVLYYKIRLRGEASAIDVRDELLVARTNSGRTVRIAWAELREVALLVSDAGPFDTDIHWELREIQGRRLRIPQDLPNDSELLSRLQALPGFDSKAVSEAMCTTDNRRFVCWRRAV